MGITSIVENVYKKDDNKKPLFPVVFVGMMSSGKSTLINALLEKDVLASSNEACTAKIYSILDTDKDEQFDVFIMSNDGVLKQIAENEEERVLDFNKEDNIKEVLISTQVKGVLNTNKKLYIIDTPGVNNSGDERHGKITREALEKAEDGLIVYVVNSANAWTTDEKKLLEHILKILKKKNVKLLFLLNKIDELDSEKESIGDFVLDGVRYLKNVGFEKFDIFPISGGAGNIFQKVLTNKKLTKLEKYKFKSFYSLFEPRDLEMSLYAITEDKQNQYEKVAVNNEEYNYSKLRKAYENTGIYFLEQYLQKAQIRSDAYDKVDNDIRLKSIGETV